MTAHGKRAGRADFDAMLANLDADALRAIVGKAAERHEEVASAVRMAASRGLGELAQLRSKIDRGLRTSQYLGYRESSGWAMHAAPIVEEIRDAVVKSPSMELVALIERAIGHVVKVVLKADDPTG